jgi:hypothetical protein
MALLDYLDGLEDRREAQAGSSNVDSTGGTEVSASIGDRCP